MKIQIFKSTNRKGDQTQWFFRIVSGNSKIIAQSEGYKRKASIHKLLTSMQRKIQYKGFEVVEVLK